MSQGALGYGCVVLSVAVHASVMLGASRPSSSRAPAVRTELELALPPPTRPEPPAPKPTPEPEMPAPKPKLAPRAQPPREAAAAAPPPAPAPASPVPPVPELSGNTLLSDTAASWAAPAGNGAERTGPIHNGSAQGTLTANATARPAPAVAPPLATEPLAQLSRKPVPPALAAVLARNYPSAARSQGKSGEAKVRALIDTLGRVASITVTFESAPEFGAACRKTLLQSQWTPPLGQLGKPTATFVTYRCMFRVD